LIIEWGGLLLEGLRASYDGDVDILRGNSMEMCISDFPKLLNYTVKNVLVRLFTGTN
jgi:hypothetical protein